MTRRRTWQRYGTVTLLLFTAALTGCGGSSSPNTLTQNQNQPVRSVDTLPDGNTHAEGQAGRVGIFLSATPDSKANTKAAHLWANILKVELIDIQEKPVTVYESQDGNSIDLNTLYEASGRRFAVLTSASVPAGKAYIRARVTFSKSFSQFLADAPTGQPLPLGDTIAHDDKENPLLSFPLTRPRDLGNGRENLVIDFDLGKTTITDGRVIPSLREGDQNGLTDLARQIPVTFVGTLQELTGKDTSTPNAKEGTDTNEATVPPDETASPAPKTSVPGKLKGSKAEKTLDAVLAQADTSITTPSTPKKATTEKLVTPTEKLEKPVDTATANPAGRVFTLSLGTNRSVAVQASDATVYDNDGAAPNPTLTDGKKAAVRGILDPTTKRILAQRVTLLSGNGPTAETTTVHGSITGFDTKNNLLTLSTMQTEGLMPAFAVITVQMAPDAIYRSRGGLLFTNEEFSAALAAQPGTLVAISGAYEPVTGTMRGRTLRLEESTPGTAHEAKVTGTAQNVDTENKTFTLTSLTLWQGIAARAEGMGIPVVTTSATVYRDEKGQFLSATTFYKEIQGGHPAQALGLYADGKLTATRLDLIPAETKASATTVEKAAPKPAEPTTEKPATTPPDKADKKETPPAESKQPDPKSV